MTMTHRALLAAAACMTLNISHAADECSIEYKPGSNAGVTKQLNAGQEYVFPAPVDQVQWVKNKKDHEVEVQVTNLIPGGTNPKWVKFTASGQQDPAIGSYVGGVVKLFRAKCKAIQESGATLTQASGASLAKATSTGIYEISSLQLHNGKILKTLALVHDGKFKEVHTRVQSGAWLQKKQGNSITRLNASTFDQLIGTSGLNVDVNTLPSSKKTQFLNLIGASSGTAPSLTTPPQGGKCPKGYESVVINGQMTCKLIAWTQPQEPSWSMQAVGGILDFLIPPAHARTWKIVWLSWSSSEVFGGAQMQWDRDTNTIQIQAGGVTAIWESND